MDSYQLLAVFRGDGPGRAVRLRSLDCDLYSKLAGEFALNSTATTVLDELLMDPHNLTGAEDRGKHNWLVATIGQLSESLAERSPLVENHI